MSVDPTLFALAREYVAAVAANSNETPRLRKLKGRGSRDAVISAATARLLTTVKTPYIGLALSPFWWARDERWKLTVNALHVERERFKKETSYASEETESPKLDLELERFTERSGAAADEPTQRLATQACDDAEQLVYSIKFAHAAAYLREVHRLVRMLKPKQRKAARLLRIGYSYEQIRQATCNAQGRMGVSERIIKPLRKKIREIDDKHRRAALAEIVDRIPKPEADNSPASLGLAPRTAPRDSLALRQGRAGPYTVQQPTESALPSELSPKNYDSDEVIDGRGFDAIAGPFNILLAEYRKLDYSHTMRALLSLSQEQRAAERQQTRDAAAAVDARAGSKTAGADGPARINKAGRAELNRIVKDRIQQRRYAASFRSMLEASERRRAEKNTGGACECLDSRESGSGDGAPRRILPALPQGAAADDLADGRAPALGAGNATMAERLVRGSSRGRRAGAGRCRVDGPVTRRADDAAAGPV